MEPRPLNPARQTHRLRAHYHSLMSVVQSRTLKTKIRPDTDASKSHMELVGYRGSGRSSALPCWLHCAGLTPPPECCSLATAFAGLRLFMLPIACRPQTLLQETFAQQCCQVLYPGRKKSWSRSTSFCHFRPVFRDFFFVLGLELILRACQAGTYEAELNP